MSTSEFEGHEALIAQLQAGTLDAPGHLHRRVLSGGAVKRRRWADMSGRRRALVLVPIAATLAVGAAVVHSAFFNSGPAPLAAGKALSALSGPHGSRGPTGPRGHTGAQGGTGVSGAIGPTAHRGPATWSDTAAEKALHHLTFAAGRPALTSSAAKSGNLRGYDYLTDLHTTAGSYTNLDSAYSGNTALYAQDQVNGSPLAMASSTVHGAANIVAIPKKRLVHADAVLGVVVANNDELASATNKATAIVTGVGGYAQSVRQGTNKRDGSSFLDLRVPVGKAQLVIQQLGSLGRLVSQQVATQDLQQTYSKQTDVVGRLRREIAVYRQALKSGSLSGTQRIDVQIELANAKYQLNAALKQRSHTVNSAATANIQLTLSTDQHAFAAPPSKRGHLGNLLHNAASFLALEAVIVLYALIVAGPILLLVGLAWWFARERRRREERQLLASA